MEISGVWSCFWLKALAALAEELGVPSTHKAIYYPI